MPYKYTVFGHAAKGQKRYAAALRTIVPRRPVSCPDRDSIKQSVSYQTAPDWQVVLKHPGAHLHLYGKRTARAGRKMGHVTVCDQNLAQALEIAQQIKRDLYLP